MSLDFFFYKILRYQDTSKYLTVLHKEQINNITFNITCVLAASKHFLLFSVQTVEAFIDVWRI